MKTTLCETCKHGLIRERDCEDRDTEGFAPCTERHFSKKCLLAKEYLWYIIISCNRYSPLIYKRTYHDPDFGEYEKNILEE
jgi:hypothetical protein